MFLLFETQVLLDVFCKQVVDFGMAWDGLLLTCCRIAVDVVPRSVVVQNTAFLFELADELVALYTVISLM